MPPLDLPIIRWDCRHYRGDKPCTHNRACEGCGHYSAFSHRIAIIKIGALGDVIRTLAILPELRRQFPDAQITWITSPAAAAFMQHHADINRIVTFDALSAISLTHERFDLLISLDKEPQPCGLAMSMNAAIKLGVGLSPVGTPFPLNAEARHYFALGLVDDLKFKQNTKSYQHLLYEALGWSYAGQTYELPLDEAAAELMHGQLLSHGWSRTKPTLGVNVGAGKVFANKMWPAARQKKLIAELHRRHPDWQVVLIGGPDERRVMDELAADLPWVIHSGSDNPAQHCLALIDHCDVLFSGDTLAMHLAIARKRGAVVFFGPTCEQEIDLFGRGEKLIAATPCSPCYKRRCDHADACLDAVHIDTAIAALERTMQRMRPAITPKAEPTRKAG
jgi:heptosyltransferase-2